MSAKNLDRHQRFRSISVSFRVSPEEQVELNRAVALSGLSKQQYCYQRCMKRDIVVHGNSRIYKALRDQMQAILFELQRLQSGGSIQPELLDTINLITATMNGLKGENPNAEV